MLFKNKATCRVVVLGLDGKVMSSLVIDITCSRMMPIDFSVNGVST